MPRLVPVDRGLVRLGRQCSLTGEGSAADQDQLKEKRREEKRREEKRRARGERQGIHGRSHVSPFQKNQVDDVSFIVDLRHFSRKALSGTRDRISTIRSIHARSPIPAMNREDGLQFVCHSRVSPSSHQGRRPRSMRISVKKIVSKKACRHVGRRGAVDFGTAFSSRGTGPDSGSGSSSLVMVCAVRPCRKRTRVPRSMKRKSN